MSMTDVDPDAMPPEPPPGAIAASMPAASGWNPSVDLTALSQSGRASGAVDPDAYDIPAQQQAPATGANLADLSRQAASIKREEMAAKERITGEEDARLAQHRKVMDARFAQTGVNPDDFKPWDQSAAQEKYRHDPVQEFGSLGSVFAMMASAFTNRPMENALLGSAAAINAAKEGKTLEFERAYKAWQDNTNLAIKRQTMQHQSYSDALSMVNSDMSIAQQRMQTAATMYGDKQMLGLMDAGLWDKVIELADKREDVKKKMVSNQGLLMLENFKMETMMGDPRYKAPPGSPQRMDLAREMNETFGGKAHDPQAEYSRKVLRENPEITSDDYNEKMDAWTSKNSEGNLLIGDRLKKKAIIAETNRNIEAGMPTDKAYYAAEQTVAENLPGKVKERKEAIVSSTNLIDKALEVLRSEKDKGEGSLNPTGFKGMLMRPGETLGLVKGQSAHEYEALVRTLQQTLGAAMPGHAKSKLNMKDRSDWDTIVPGLGRYANIDASIEELERLKKIVNRQDLQGDSKPIAWPTEFKNDADGTRRANGDRVYRKQGGVGVPE